jgi:hypothetical protein
LDELRKGIAIGMLFGSGDKGHGNLMTKTATENGVYTAAEEINPETGEIFDPPKDGYSLFTVALPLDDKTVALSTSDITGSQSGTFEYDPHEENPELEGYSLFTIDLSGVKDDIEDLQQQIADAEACRQQVIAALQRYDPDYDPAEGECPASKAEDLVVDYETVSEEAEQCHDCWEEVVATLQKYDPDYNPQEGECPADEIDKVANDTLPDIDPSTGQPKHPTGKVPDKPDFDNWIDLNTTPMKDPTRFATNLLEVEYYTIPYSPSFYPYTLADAELYIKISWAGEIIYNHRHDSGMLQNVYVGKELTWRVSDFSIICFDGTGEYAGKLSFMISDKLKGHFVVNGQGERTEWQGYTFYTNYFTSEYTAQEINDAIQNSQWTIQ